MKAVRAASLAAVLGLLAGAAFAQDEDPAAVARAQARGAFDLCRGDAPDAAAVAEHGEVWGWPHFVPYLEHPLGFQRQAGGESRRTLTIGAATADLELTVQSGVVTAAAPAQVTYFRCNFAADQPVNSDLEAYFTDHYGPPAARDGDTVVWLKGSAGLTADPAAGATEDAALKLLSGAGPGASVTRIELSRERGLDRAKLSLFQNG